MYVCGKIDIPLEPAIKPKIRAFSGRVTLFAVLNISCASNICSRCNPIIKNENLIFTTIHTINSLNLP